MAAVATSIPQGKTSIPTYNQVPETKYEREKARQMSV